MSLRRLPELLAPAGSPDALKAAVAAGADAVYLSGKRFGARKFAANFSEQELKDAINYAHLHGVKVYITVNTLIRDDELSDAALYLLKLYEMGADAVLVQDVGLASFARKIAPELNLHASTQMTIHNSDGAAWAARLGMKRVVLSREVSLEEVQRMPKDLGIGLEAFIHGALCYCYSGQCLLSSAIGGRSGNRGMCAQPCRKPYVLLRGDKDDYGRPIGLSAAPVKEQFLISTRDLSVYSKLDKIVRSPIESLKIEGRMKSPEYVAIVTSIYRRALDKIARGTWHPSEDDMRDLALAFNRDFTDGYLLSSKNIMGREMSDNRGVLIGSVASYDSQRGEASVRLTGALSPEQGDGLVFLAPGQELGLVVYKPNFKDGLLRLRIPGRVRPGAKVYMTSSNALSRKAKEIASHAAAQIPLDLKITWDEYVPVASVEGPKGIGRIEIRAGFQMEPALKKPLTEEQIETQLRRMGGTPFFIRKMEVVYPGGLFAPISAINQFRRDILEKAEAALLQAHRPSFEKVAAAHRLFENTDLETSARSISKIPTLTAYADSFDAIKGAIEGGCRRIYFEPHLGKGYSQKEYARNLLDLLKDAKKLCANTELVWKWPRVTKDKYLNFAVPLLAKADVDGVMVEGIGAAMAVASAAPKMPISGSASLNIWNHLTVWQLSQFRRLTLSPELSFNHLSELVARARTRNCPEMELIIQGNLEVMVTEDCLPCLVPGRAEFWGLQDFKRIFPLYADDDSRTHILNSVETCLIDYMPRLFEIGLDGLAIDARGRTERYAKEMAELYIRAIALTQKGEEALKKDLDALKDEARLRSLGGITTGHFLKGLKEELS